jgi:hypothetical protein
MANDTLDDARQAWAQRFLAAVDAAGKEAERLRLFSSAEHIHVALIETAIVNLLSCCDLPEDGALVSELVQDAFDRAVRTMKSAMRVQ